MNAFKNLFLDELPTGMTPETTPSSRAPDGKTAVANICGGYEKTPVCGVGALIGYFVARRCSSRNSD